MALIGVSALGRTNLHFVDPGITINGQYYRDTLLMRYVLPDIKQSSPDSFTFQQDGAPAHRARETANLLSWETPDFIPPDLWPPNSPDLNLVDYKIWGIMQDGVYAGKITSVDEIKQRISDEWNKIDQQLIDSAVKQWHKRLAACVSARGGHLEHML